MTTKPDDADIESDRAREAAIPKRQILTDGVDLEAYRDEITRRDAVIAERDAEIERLRDWLAQIDLDPDAAEQGGWAARALAGDEVSS